MKVSTVLVSAIAVVFGAPSLTEQNTDQYLAQSFVDALDDGPSEQKALEPEEFLPDELQEDDLTETNRKKKSATTTFCVEVKPNSPYQKPYELCESGNEIYAVSSSEGISNAPVASIPVVAAPIYGPPQKTYAAVASSSGYVQSAPVHSTGYKSSGKTYEPKKYRTSEDAMMVDHSAEEEENMKLRSSYGYGGYGGGGMVKFIGAEDQHKKKGHGHSGLVITCQPNLAGYATPVHAAGYGGAYGGAYRDAKREEMMHPHTKATEEPKTGRSSDYDHYVAEMPGGYGQGMTPGHLAPYEGSRYSMSLPAYSGVPSSYPAPSPFYHATTHVSHHAYPPSVPFPSGRSPDHFFQKQPLKPMPSRSNMKMEMMEDGQNTELGSISTMKKIMEDGSQWNHEMRNPVDHQKEEATAEVEKKAH